ncbi:MAG: hypothetical protein NTU80_05730 [Verrucomicrobia bacterium]|nr:hypothetical protein [Verrucomicrobiota bacterium]
MIYKIPKYSDKEIAERLNRVRIKLKDIHGFKIIANIPHIGGIELPLENPTLEPRSKFIFDLNSQVINQFNVLGENGQDTLVISRKTDEVTDNATYSQGWSNSNEGRVRERAALIHANFLSALQSELSTIDVVAAAKGSEDSAWNRYRDAQTAVINSLQHATETLIIKAAERNTELDKARAERFDKLEITLREQSEHERKTLQSTFEQKHQQLTEREKAIADREASFNTKEARYVARKKQEEQIDQVKNWLSDWRLTTGTTAKRRPIFWAYISALIITGGLTAYATYHNYQLLKSADDIAKLAWWNWVAITTKSFFPLAAFTTFMIYFIRWSSSWARQHADEEFRNRTRLIDIGRSGWLLEAVRDAQENKNEIPVDLLKELSRNLFSNAGSNEADIHPQAVSDMLLQGLSSVRVKSADGSEVEATRNGKKK